MSKVVDLKGKVFGKLTVIEYAGSSKEGKATWRCKCDCGNEKTAKGYHLSRGCTQSCGCLRNRDYAKDKHPIKHGQYMSTRYSLLKNAKSRAKKKKIPCTITLDDIPSVPEVCPILGIKLTSYKGEGKKGLQPDSPTLDRIIPEKGYIPGNIQIISGRANMIKNDATPSELQAVADYVHSCYVQENRKESHGSTGQ